MKKIPCVVFLIICLVITTFIPVSAYTFPAGTEVEAQCVVLYNFNSDTVVYRYNSNERREPASLTKLMTALIVAETDSEPENTYITADSQSILDISGTGASNANLKTGEVMSSLDLLRCLLISSGCDAANVLATHYAGSISAFVEKMNERAVALGMNDTHFANAHGLSATGQYTTADDLLILAKEVCKFEVLTEICSKSRYTVPATNMSDERVLTTTNLMLDPSTDAYYKYTTGLKTGYTDNAGRCLISTAEKGNERYLCVMLGCPVYGSDGRFIRREFSSSANLYRWAFNDLQLSTVCDTSTPRAEIKIKYSAGKDHLLATAANEIKAVIPKASSDSVIVEPHIETDTLTAPVTAGTKVGYAEVFCAGESLGTVDLIITEDCAHSTIKHIFGVLGSIFTSKLFIIIVCLAVAAFVIFIIINILYNRKRRKKYRASVYRRYK